MHLLKVTCYDEPEYLLLKENRVVARWSASEAWGAFVERLLERVVEEPIQTVDVTPVLQDLLERCNESLEVSLEALVESLIALYGLEGLFSERPLDEEKARALLQSGLPLVDQRNVWLRFRS